MKTHRWKDVRSKGMTPERVVTADVEARREAMAVRLRNLRKAAGLTQSESMNDRDKAPLFGSKRKERAGKVLPKRT